MKIFKNERGKGHVNFENHCLKKSQAIFVVTEEPWKEEKRIYYMSIDKSFCMVNTVNEKLQFTVHYFKFPAHNVEFLS